MSGSLGDTYTFTSNKTASEILAADTVIIHMDVSDLFGFEGDYYIINITDWGASEGPHEFLAYGYTPWSTQETNEVISFQENADTGFISYEMFVNKEV